MACSEVILIDKAVNKFVDGPEMRSGPPNFKEYFEWQMIPLLLLMSQCFIEHECQDLQ